MQRLPIFLRWEGIVIDLLGALLAVLVFDFIISRQADNALEIISLVFGHIVLIGSTTGALAADHLAHESGLLAVTIMGMVLANLKDTDIDDIPDFKEIGWHALSILAVMMFLARPLSEWVSTFTSDLKTKEKLLISWIGPRASLLIRIFA